MSNNNSLPGSGQYIVTIDGLIININNDLDDCLNVMSCYINNSINLIKENDGNVHKFIGKLSRLKIVLYKNNIDQGYYYFNNKFVLCNSNNNLKYVKYVYQPVGDVGTNHFKQNETIFNNIEVNSLFGAAERAISADSINPTESQKDISNIFIPSKANTTGMLTSEKINCNLPVNVSDLVLIKNQSTESLINSCLNNEIEISNEKKEKLKQLQNSINELEKMKNEEIKKQNDKLMMEKRKADLKIKKIEQKRKLLEEKESNYRGKFLVDRRLYGVFKKEISNGKRSINNIPPLFIKQWSIFKEMEDNNMLNLELKVDELPSNEKYQTLNDELQKELNIYRTFDKKCVNKDFGDSYASLFKSMDMNELMFSRQQNQNSDDNEDCDNSDFDDNNDADDENNIESDSESESEAESGSGSGSGSDSD